PIFRVLRHSDEFIVGMSGAHSEDRYGAHASREQEIAHRYPPCDSAAVTDARVHAGTSGSAPIQWEDFRQRVTAHRRRRRNLALMPPPGLRGYVRFPKPTFLKPEVARSLFPRLIGRNHHFLAFVEATGLDAAKNLTRRRISIVSCVVRSFSLVPCNHASTCT